MDGYTGELEVSTGNGFDEYYSAYGAEDHNYTMNRFLNPWYGYYFELLPNYDNTSYVVAFTNGYLTEYFFTPNRTVVYNNDGSFTVTYNNGTSFYYPSSYSDQNYTDYNNGSYNESGYYDYN